MITSDFIPKDKQNGYQRWELDSLETPEFQEKDQDHETENPIEEELNKVVPPTEEEIAAVFQHAKEEGYEAGLQEGKSAGYKEGREIAETEVKAEIARLQMLLSKLDHDLHEIDQQVANDLLDLAIALAKKVVAQALELNPKLIIPVVQEAIRNLPNVMNHPRLFLHPDDAALINAHLSDRMEQDNWQVREDPQIVRGGCRIEAGGSEINATLETRWHRALAAIGQNSDWFDGSE
ncbi:flagellar assembly protein FliH [Nitrosomonas sp. wSCUT-2]